ncbi:MAG: Rpn family recombination-promoting nuclease/putative transposase, partial [Magnetococcales bacterium]|nr:Rpn family recombination-promoting nuclease/putative transposase [Magnetococcales bacterium]
EVEILDPYQAPPILDLKESILDVRVKDQSGRSYIIEMQLENHSGWTNRMLYNLCKAYVGQLPAGHRYHELADVVALAITDFISFPMLTRTICPFHFSADENPAIRVDTLRVVFVELPKFTKKLSELTTTVDCWLYFLKEASKLQEIPAELMQEPAIRHAFQIAERMNMSQHELDVLEYWEMRLATERYDTELKQKQAEAKEKQAEAKEKQAEAKEKQAE